MKKSTLALLLLVLVCNVVFVSCYNNSTPNPNKETVKALISNSLHVTSTSNVPALEVVGTQNDLLGSAIGVGNLSDVGAMDLSINKKLTLVYGPSSNAFELIDNSTTTATLTTASLPDSTESFFIAQDNKHAYAAVPNAPVNGQDPGAVYEIDLSSGNFSGIIPVPRVRYLTRGLFDGRILAFGDDSHVTIITPANIGTNTDPRVTIDGFDHPVGAVIDPGGQLAYILECGPECGGIQAAVTSVNLATNTAGTRIPVPGATAGVRDGQTIYVAGSAPGTPCGSGTAATTCGTLSTIDLVTFTLTNATPITISDGRHDHLEVAADHHLYVGARRCTNINSGGETRGCLTIVNPATSAVVFPPDNGDVTGIAPIPGRNAVYVIQGGELRIYDTTTNALLPNHQINIIGQLTDVKIIGTGP